ncbi:hypothetical protein LguiB_007623 [Lonicera macranthoides]
MSMLRRISTIAKLTPYSSIITPYIKKEEANEKKEKNKDEEEEVEENEKNKETGVEGEEDEFDKKFDEFMSGEFRRRNQILCQFLKSLEHVEVEEADDLSPGHTQIVISMDEEEINEHKFNPADFPKDRVKDFFTDFVLLDYACMSKRDFKSLITISSELKTNADVLEKKEKENPKGGGKAGGKKEEEKKGEEDKKDEKKGEEEKKDENKGEEEKKDGKKEERKRRTNRRGRRKMGEKKD